MAIRLFVYFLPVYFSLAESTECVNAASSCITCSGSGPNLDALVNCTVMNRTQSLYEIICEDSPSCKSQTFNIVDGETCTFSLQHKNGSSWKYSAYLVNFANKNPCECKTQLFSVNSHQDIYSQSFDCFCNDQDNCNRLFNVTVTIQPSDVGTSSSLNTLQFLPSIMSSIQQTSSVDPVAVTTSTGGTLMNHSDQADSITVFISIITALVLVIAIILSIFVFFMCFYRKQTSSKSHHLSHTIKTHPVVQDATQPPSGDGFPLVILNEIGFGRFGTVYRATTSQNIPIALKIFTTNRRSTWNNERRIYGLQSTLHENILHCIRFEQRGNVPKKQLYRISEYHALGSLSHFLQHNKLSWDQTLRIIHSVSCGLSHLHSNSYIDSEDSVEEKLSIAHRDVKSANVLVKDVSGHCVLGDLGLGLILDPAAKMEAKRKAHTEQVGTYRYMAPEALDARVNLRDIESFKQIDVYALALVLWEACTRCELSDNLVPPYQPPYSNLVGERPTLELMKHVVVVEKSRPHLMGYWESHPGLKEVINILEESWDEDPEARLTAANIVSRLESLERAQRKEELGNEVELSSNNGSVITEPHTHKNKVRVSSSFSGQPLNQPVIQRVRLSVGNQRYPRRNSMAHHSDLRESSFVTDAESHTTRFSNCEIPISLNDSQLIEQEHIIINNDNETQVNIDAATGQPSALSQSSYVSIVSLDSIGQ